MGYWDYDSVDVEVLEGQTLAEVYRVSDDSDELVFVTTEGVEYRMRHHQDCCEHVYISDIVGDLSDLIGEPLTIASKRSGDIPDAGESGTWTFYAFATRKGYVDIRWNGYSNGYYSEGVSFDRINPSKDE